MYRTLCCKSWQKLYTWSEFEVSLRCFICNITVEFDIMFCKITVPTVWIIDCLHFFVLIHNKRLEAHIAHLSDFAKYFDQSSFMKTNTKILIQNVFCCFSFNILKFKTISGCIDTYKKNFINCSMVIY